MADEAKSEATVAGDKAAALTASLRRLERLKAMPRLSWRPPRRRSAPPN